MNLEPVYRELVHDSSQMSSHFSVFPVPNYHATDVCVRAFYVKIQDDAMQGIPGFA